MPCMECMPSGERCSGSVEVLRSSIYRDGFVKECGKEVQADIPYVPAEEGVSRDSM